MVDDRTNTLIVAASPAGYERAKALVERLDIALDIEGGATFHVYKLGSAIADELAVTLTSAIGGQQPKAKAPAALDTLGAALEGQVRVISDKPSNSLLVMSSGRDFLAIKQIIRELDQPRRQVYIEALILELAVNNNSTIGTSSHGALPVAGTSLLLGGARTGVDTTSVEPLGATWSTRSFDTKVVVRDQEAVVIGGLIQERVESFETKVPVLGDIPLFGHLFKSTQKVKRKTNLVILLTPYIIKDQMDLQTIRERKLREYDELTRSTSSFARMKYEPRIDYRRKRGLVEEIHRTLHAIDEDVTARASLSRPATVKPGPIEVPPGE